MRKILIAIDMQNDFIDGSLGTKEALAIVPAVLAKLSEYEPEDIFATRDTHSENYMESQEGKNLPVPHCIKGTDGWEIRGELKERIPENHVFDKPSFGSLELAKYMEDLAAEEKEKGEEIMIELLGLCTDICVVSNALLLKAHLPEVPICVDSACCAGVTPEKHEAALETMRSCQIGVK